MTNDRIVPVAQANRVELIAVVVDAIANGADTTERIAEALSYSHSQGPYYGNAAEELGYTCLVQEEPFHIWTLTSEGEDYLAMGPEDRVQDICARILDNYNVQRLLSGLDIDTGGADGSADRRTTSYAAWIEFVEMNFDDQAALLTASHAGTVQRARALPPRQPEVLKRNCPSCNMVLPSGNDNCDFCN